MQSERACATSDGPCVYAGAAVPAATTRLRGAGAGAARAQRAASHALVTHSEIPRWQSHAFIIIFPLLTTAASTAAETYCNEYASKLNHNIYGYVL